MKVKKGWMVVQVGLEDEGENGQRLEIPINLIYHPLFMNLLDRAREVYGYHVDGPLKLPCSIDDFLDLRWRIERESNSTIHPAHQQHNSSNHHQHHRHYVNHALSFRSC
ncbi:auxin-induced protein X10A-like [Silene latifolia]|uniref:auxin-induced protein X10A-like n=1 Tax=Silene latifolia TaxID=37657 RepID=UPI003D76F56C